MSTHRFGSLAREMMWWREADNLSFERARYFRSAMGARIFGTVHAAEKSQPLTVSYWLTCDSEWRTTALAVRQTYNGERRNFRLERRAGDRWDIKGAEIEALQGCTDVDLGITPSTNALPVNRLRLGVGEQATIKAAWVRVPDLTVTPVNQLYARIAEKQYRYRNLDSGYTTILTVDADGFPIDYEGVWRRVANWTAPPREAPMT